MVYEHPELYLPHRGVNMRCDKDNPFRFSSRGIVLAIPQSVQTQKIVINTLVYLVYGYYNSSTMKEVD
jgi:hypothetical protein